jgi:hypothetical protein
MDSERDDVLNTLGRIRDNVLLLRLANAYLCDAPFLRRIGRDMDSTLLELREDILTLKKQFPGRFATKVETEGLLEELHKKAQWLQSPDNEITEKCIAGDLGKELEAKVDVLCATINTIRNQVGGKTPAYSRKDSISFLVGRGSSFVSGFPLRIVKVLILLILAAALAFGYLYMTMEKEEGFVKEVSQSQAYIQSQLKIISSLDYERQQISSKIESLRGREHDRRVKIEMMELNEQNIKLDEKRRQVEVEIATHEGRVKQNQTKADAMRSKSFIKRLLRQ